ncbi:MAG: hypothetical protein ACYC7D_00850 [Nitrososphaerales archaeon]
MNLPLNVLLQVKVPGSLLGRVGATLGALASASQPIASVSAGGIANVLDIGRTFEIFGVLIVIFASGTMIVFSALRGAKY